MSITCTAHLGPLDDFFRLSWRGLVFFCLFLYTPLFFCKASGLILCIGAQILIQMSCLVKNTLSGWEHHLARGLAHQNIKLLKPNNMNLSLQPGWRMPRESFPGCSSLVRRAAPLLGAHHSMSWAWWWIGSLSCSQAPRAWGRQWIGGRRRWWWVWL